MKVFWFTNALVPQAYTAFGISQTYYGGGWSGALLEELSQCHPEMDFCVASADSVRRTERVRQGRIEYVRFPCRRPLPIAVQLVREYQPDVVHVHGSEFFYGLVALEADICRKTVISLQGLIGPCSTWPCFFGNLTPLQVARTHRLPEIGVWRGLFPSYLSFQRAAARERAVLSRIRHVMGRTEFDRAYALMANPEVRYHHVGELLREPFWRQEWSLNTCTRNSIIFSNAGHPRKGVEVLLDAFGYVRQRYPDARLRVAGGISTRSGYGRHIRKVLVSREGVDLLGSLSADQMVQALCGSHVFVSPSFIDNSCNSACEAQLLGMPVVATYVGGVPSLVEDGSTGLMTIAGDASTLAMKIMRFLADDSLALRCGRNAHTVAAKRHAREQVISDLYATYQHVAESSESVARTTVPAQT